MGLLNKELVEFIFNYINEFGEYVDKEELAFSGGISKEEEESQLKFEEFVFNVLKICTKQKKYYYDNSNCFENYTLYLNYKSDQIEVFIMYGQGNYFEVNAATEGYKQELSLDLEKIV